MIVTKKYAKALIRKGKAREVSSVREQSGADRWWIAVERLDVQRTDHYRGTARDRDRANSHLGPVVW